MQSHEIKPPAALSDGSGWGNGVKTKILFTMLQTADTSLMGPCCKSFRSMRHGAESTPPRRVQRYCCSWHYVSREARPVPTKRSLPNQNNVSTRRLYAGPTKPPPWGLRKWPHRNTNQFIRRCHPNARKSVSQAALSRTQITLHATRRTPHGASRLVHATRRTPHDASRLVLAMSAWVR